MLVAADLAWARRWRSGAMRRRKIKGAAVDAPEVERPLEFSQQESSRQGRRVPACRGAGRPISGPGSC